MNYKGHVFLDWDDTIAVANDIVNSAAATIRERLERAYGLPSRVIADHASVMQVEYAKRYGLGAATFIRTWQDVARWAAEHSGAPEDEALLAAIAQDGEDAFSRRQPLYPGGPELVRWLREEALEITVWTAGDPRLQEARVRSSGLLDPAERVVVVRHKTAETLAAALDGRSPSRTAVIGNSPRSDIAPALALGLTAIHVESSTWDYDHVALDTRQPGYVKVESLFEVPAVLRQRLEVAS